MAVTWRKNLQLEDKDETDEIDYVWQWGTWLAGADIASAVVTGSNLTVESYSVIDANQNVTCRITGGTAGTMASVTCTVTTNETPARVVERSVNVYVNNL